MSVGHLRPRWMVLGVDMEPDGVTIWFSDSPDRATVEVVRREPDFDHFGPVISADVDHVLFTIRTKTYRWVKGATYEEALRRLFDSWTPTTERDPAVRPQPAIPPAPARGGSPMNGDETCTCGDVYDEHEEGGGPCTVEDPAGRGLCPCIQFEADGD